MPPFIPHKRHSSTSPPSSVTSKPKSAKKPNLFETADKSGTTTSLKDNKAFLDQLDGLGSDESVPSDVSTTEFEDVAPEPSSKRRKTQHHEAEDDEIDWEDAAYPAETTTLTTPASPSGDLEITLGKDTTIGSFTNPHDLKKGPSKIERQIRVATHCAHVQFLLFHNLIRNGWAGNKEVQEILVSQLPPKVRKEVDKWRVRAGFSPSSEMTDPLAKNGRPGGKRTRGRKDQRDWGRPAERQEKGAPDMSRGDPILRLLKVLAAYWRKRFTITAPGLRKQGYKSLATLDEEIASYKINKHNNEEHGERVGNLQEFKLLAKTCEGSRDVGAQLFTALIRGLQIDARLVASLQPIGFGWSKGEEASAKKKKMSEPAVTGEAIESDSDESDRDLKSKVPNGIKTGAKRSVKKSSKGAKESPIDLSEKSDDLGKDQDDDDEEDDVSVIDVTPSTPRRRPNMHYDRDMPCPTYWTEVVSPISNEVYPVDPLVLTLAVATNPDQLCLFEPRGAKADKAKQIIAYVVAYSSDGTAKEVTTRYLKRHMWPGRTKGMRMPVEKVPVFNKRGKIKRHEDYDWFKRVMSGYSRIHAMRTAVDDLEDAKDLKAAKPEKNDKPVREDTLQGYKTSAEFVLERHLRREEALRPGSKPVKTFTSGKGDKFREEAVYRREDVEVCRTGESWHKEGRAIKADQYPMKMVPVRAVTLTRKREVEEAERDTGEKLKQGLYSWNQTDWIIPPPIENGIIPKNAFGNIDCYVPTMVPKGAVHIPLRSTVRICKRLGFDYAEAVTGFEFGNKRAVPVITGVVVAKENEEILIDEWEKEEEERRIKEEGKREKTALATWRKWLMGLRIVQRVREEYGEDADAHMREEMNPFTNQSKTKKRTGVEALHNVEQDVEAAQRRNENAGGDPFEEDDLGAGGFLPEGHDEEELSQRKDVLIVEDEEMPFTYEGPPPFENSTTTADDDAQDRDEDRFSMTHRGVTNKAKQSRHFNGDETEAKVVRSKAIDAPPRKRTQRGSKGKRSIFHERLELDEAIDPIEGGSRKMSGRATPRRKAAGKSSAAVKSHYFYHESDESDESDEGGNSSHEEEASSRRVLNATKKEQSDTPTSSRSLRVRKSR